MPDLEIIFKTKAELAGAIAAKEALERQVGAAKALGQATTELEAKIARMNQTLAQHAAAAGAGGLGHFLAEVGAQSLKAIPGLEGVAGAVAKLARGPLTVATVGLQAAALGFQAIGKSIGEFAKAEADVAKLDSALAQTGQLTDEYRVKLQALSHELSESTAKSGGQWLEVLTRLTQFGADATNINEYAEAVKNLAGIMGGNITEAAFIFSKAMGGNFEMLHRWGITAKETGTLAERMDDLFIQLAQRGGGQLEAQTKTLEGHFTLLEHATRSTFASFGQFAGETLHLNGLLDNLTYGFNHLAGAIGHVIPAAEGLKNAQLTTKLAIEETEKVAEEHAKNQLKRINELRAAQNAATDELLERAIKIEQMENSRLDAIEAEQIATIKLRALKKEISPEEESKQIATAKTAGEKRRFESGQQVLAMQSRAADDKYSDAVAEAAGYGKAAAAAEDAASRQGDYENRLGNLANAQTELANLEAQLKTAQTPGARTHQGGASLYERISEARKNVDDAKYIVGRYRADAPPGDKTAEEWRQEAARLRGLQAATEADLPALGAEAGKSGMREREARTNREVFESKQREEETDRQIEALKRKNEEDKKRAEQLLKEVHHGVIDLTEAILDGLQQHKEDLAIAKSRIADSFA